MSPYLAIFDWLSVLALIFMSIGIFKQWMHIQKTGSADDIVTQEVLTRFIITWILFVKIVLVGDIYLIIGQVVLGIAITMYFITLLHVKSRLPK
ncbi:MAG: hypothetical protein A2741_02965 [Candidatus Zambryskibacteria bacterium RIFCSPHIGHO2_01_FULL_43_27]|uniref:Uncharacterized protein n=1 Tax=Candidatus Zambryskibacteria bacterium RIFCSPLOWO2_01_FULL_43_17 TaxID=1802760 RepID=A0A1G2U205_9BACT|nr:MAG: hypothetical protein A2741_02965 [Candidatus Zambryskibacteria bacterium RIFCSPHIGHO2_01_FULL_43_27]OHA99624.1 MAG: hypothetical protein A3E93_00625 [Candidatus Zambryskibacteria bacterium RIFCSPHIGHO2_12_FULL_43_12b]OHB03547.1 MAG: hypothetical protein A2920_02700 [Candidatus Zambryskibacteria bacterium RIFCSPLOWO2_01_FULL_43_17]